jgi:uncharacterized protein
VVERDQDRPLTRRPWLAGVAGVNALAAWVGALGLATGGTDFGATINERLPFDSLLLAGVALVAVVAVPLTALAWSAWAGGSRTDDLAFVAGLALIGWIVGQAAVIRAFSLFQPLYLAVGASLVAASHRVVLTPARRGVLLIAVGSTTIAVGAGLVPHVVKDGLSVLAVSSVVLLLAGIGAVVVGGAGALRDRHRLVRLAGGAATVLVVAITASIVAPAVAATAVPPSDLTRTPSTVGLDHESVTLTTDDGVALAAWYLEGTNDAGVVLVHGAGSTRSDVLDQAAVLVRAGYAVVLEDARGHGESEGTAMDFGWYGDLDVVAGVDFLASHVGIEPGRIGIVGFSMGGEEAIGAAAADGRIGAVVAEGATARQATDKAWLSDVYGTRGWVQEQIERAQYGVADFLTDASPPIALRSAVERADHTRFLLLAAGTLADEHHAASHIQAGARDRVEVWNVDGAGHTDGYRTQPDQWQQRVVGFLDAHLR